MCIMLPVSHIPCTHTIGMWQHCIDATRSRIEGPQPCWNVRKYDRAIFTRKLCEICGGLRFFACRGGIAERGNGSCHATLKTKEIVDPDEADDSGYHSDVIHENDEPPDVDIEPPLSPRAQAPPQLRIKWVEQRERKRRPSNESRSLNRKPGWKPDLKQDLNLQYEGDSRLSVRRDSIDSMMSKLGDSAWYESRVQRVSQQKKTEGTTTASYSSSETSVGCSTPSRRRDSTLLHPSSPPVEATVRRQNVQAFPFPKAVHVRKPTNSRSATPPAVEYTPSHPSPPFIEATNCAQNADSPSLTGPTSPAAPKSRRPAMPGRKASSLLHPSIPTSPTLPLKEHKTILSVLPSGQIKCVPKISTLRRLSPAQAIPTSRLPPPLFTPAAPLTASSQQRRASILHSCLSDTEDEGLDEVPFPSVLNRDIRTQLDTYAFAQQGLYHAVTNTESFEDHDAEEAEGALLVNTARIARSSRRRMKSGIITLASW